MPCRLYFYSLCILSPRALSSPPVHPARRPRPTPIPLSCRRLAVYSCQEGSPTTELNPPMAHERRWNLYLPAAIIVVVLSAQLAQGGNTACVSNQLSWYTSVVGESPCKSS